MYKTLLYDDRSGDREDWTKALRRIEGLSEHFDVHEFNEVEFVKSVEVLHARRKRAREANENLKSSTDGWAKLQNVEDIGATVIDDVDVLIVDYDLLYMPEEGRGVTGEEVAYLARCYSDCGYIIALNQFGKSSFNLRLASHFESFADLNVGSRELDSPGLWLGTEQESFRPWMWPCILRELENIGRRRNDVSENLECSVLDFLELEQEHFTRSLAQYVLDDQDRSVTVGEFAANTDLGFREKDQPSSRSSLIRVAADRLYKWLDRIVLPAQDPLVDGPHLAVRYPSLLKDRENPDESVTFRDVSWLSQDLESYRFGKSHWLSRPAWLWPALKNNSEIHEVADPWGATQLDKVFCEDISRFISQTETESFVAEVGSVHVQRYCVKRQSDTAARFSLGDVEYSPKARFAY